VTVIEPFSRNVDFVYAPVSDLDNGYDSYRKIGGLLSKARYEEFVIIGSAFQKDRISSQGINQASNMARFANIELTPQEIFVYGYLRNIKGGREKTGIPSQDASSQPDVCSLTDQRLLAEILLMEGKLDVYQRFTKAYQNIFNHGVSNKQ
jgi:hypothetical protein